MVRRPGVTSPGTGAFDRVVRNSGWLVGAYLLAFGLAFVQNVLLARSLGPAEFGLLAIVIFLVTFVQLLVGSRVWEAATTFVVRYRAHGDAARTTATVKLCYLVDAIGAGVGALLLLALAAPASRIFGEGTIAGPIRLYALSLLLAIPMATASALLRVADRYRWLAVQTVGENLIRLLAVSVVLATFGPQMEWVIAAYLLAVAASAASLLWLASRVRSELGLIPWRAAPLRVLAEDLGAIVRFLLYSNLSGTARVLTGRVDVLIVGWLTDPASVGFYRLARSVSDPLAALATPVSQVVFPEISKLATERDVDGIRRLTRRVRQLAVVLVVPACVLTTLLAGWAIPAVFGESFAPAVPLVRIMVWQLLWIPYVWVSALLLSLGRARTVAAMSALDAAIYVALLLVLVPAFGVTGAAWATLGRFVAWTAVAATVGTRVDRGLELRWT